MEFEETSNRVIGCAIEVHRELGPGLLESAYEQCLAHERGLAGISVAVQVLLPVIYKQVRIDCGYRVDLFVEGQLILELQERRACVADPRGTIVDVHEVGQRESRPSHELQRRSPQGRH